MTAHQRLVVCLRNDEVAVGPLKRARSTVLRRLVDPRRSPLRQARIGSSGAARGVANGRLLATASVAHRTQVRTRLVSIAALNARSSTSVANCSAWVEEPQVVRFRASNSLAHRPLPQAT